MSDKETKDEVEEEFGPVCLYKGDKSEVFESKEEVDKALKAGWKDEPPKSKDADK